MKNKLKIFFKFFSSLLKDWRPILIDKEVEEE